jgi:pimeloyl-ACP methyl ester carboxylesterase
MAGFRSDISRDRDILLIDHRGTGNSAGLHCDTPCPGGVSSRFETVFPLDHVEACRTMLSEHTDLSEYTTPIAMDDLAELSSWLEYTQLNLSGGLYGTREAQVFTRRHPDMVRTVVLNGVAPVDDRIYLYHARYLQNALENLFEECESQPDCRAAYPDFRAVTAEVLETAKNTPPTEFEISRQSALSAESVAMCSARREDRNVAPCAPRVVGRSGMIPYRRAPARNNAPDPQTCAAKGAIPAPMVLIAPLMPHAQGTIALSSVAASTKPCGNR